MTDAIVQPSRSGEASSNPLLNWANDDLILTEHAQHTIAKAFPRAFRILDWETFREEFKKHDASANLAKKKVNRHGATGALLSAVGASLLALAPLFPTGAIQSLVIVLGCGLVVVGGLMGVWHLLGHSSRAKWLLERLWTERLRQFYFQYPINNCDEAVAAMANDVELETYRSLRDGALLAFVDDMSKNITSRSFADAIRWLANDNDDARAWGQGSWQTNRVAPGTLMTNYHRELLECLANSRIEIQEIYSQSNLKRGASGPGEMARQTLLRGNIATLVFVVSLILAGTWVLFSSRQGMLPSDIMIALSGIAAAWGLYFRLVDQGMGYSLDAERYELYAEQVRLVRQRFNASAEDVYGKIAALRHLELYTYREMRQFLRTHLRSRFLG